MDASAVLAELSTVEGLIKAGRFAEVVSFVDQLGDARTVLTRSPTLALLFGTARARLGEYSDGDRWVALALRQGEQHGDGSLVARALNVRGAIALESGRLEDAAQWFTKALDEASRQGDHSIVGRCSNNLGIIASVHGDHGRAIGSYTMALAAFQRAGYARGVAEAHHNLAIAYREQGSLDRALEESEQAMEAARRVGDEGLAAQALAGRAEVRIFLGDAAMAKAEADAALATHRRLGDVVAESEDLRIVGVALAGLGRWDEAERTLRDVEQRAAAHGRPLLAAAAVRDQAMMLESSGRRSKALEAGNDACRRFAQLGATAERDKLERWLDERI